MVPKYIDAIFKEGHDLMINKNSDYSGKRIDNISITGIEGISVRLLDKVSRFYNLTHTNKQFVKDESIRDTLIDIMNYANIGIQLIDGVWQLIDSDVADLSRDLLSAINNGKYRVLQEDDGEAE